MLLRIAYCDDEIENGKKIKDYINQLMIQIEVEFELDFYVSGTVLLENVKKQNDYYDMVLLDMEMPDMNGIEIAEKIRELVSREVLITFLTSYPEYMQKSFVMQKESGRILHRKFRTLLFAAPKIFIFLTLHYCCRVIMGLLLNKSL